MQVYPRRVLRKKKQASPYDLQWVGENRDSIDKSWFSPAEPSLNRSHVRSQSQKTPLGFEWRFLRERWRCALRPPASVLVLHRLDFL
jgi:hypothetical protein